MTSESQRKISLAVLLCVFLCLCAAIGYVLGAYASSLKDAPDSGSSKAASANASASTSSSTSASNSSAGSSSAQAASSSNPENASSASSSSQASASSISSSSSASSSASASSSLQAASSAASSARAKAVDPPARDALLALLGEEVTSHLIANAQTDEDAAWIAAHPESLDGFRAYIQVEALTLAASEPQAAAFVRGMPEHANVDIEPNYKAAAMKRTSPSADVPDTAIPHLYQWDLRWGYTPYDGDPFGMSGCGPVSLAMVYQGLTGKDDKTPYDMGQIALANGFVRELTGTDDGFFFVGAEQVGLRCEALIASPESIRSALSEGKPLIVHVGPGAFSQVGHYFVLAGITGDGKAIVNDPYSVERSSQLWDVEQIAIEAITLYAYSLA